jgi:hypothetical protein
MGYTGGDSETRVGTQISTRCPSRQRQRSFKNRVNISHTHTEYLVFEERVGGMLRFFFSRPICSEECLFANWTLLPNGINHSYNTFVISI